MVSLKITFVFLCLALVHGKNSQDTWNDRVETFMDRYATMWGEELQEDIVKNLFVCDLVRLGPGQDPVYTASETIQTYQYFYNAGYTKLRIDKIGDVFPTGDNDVVAWVKMTFIKPGPDGDELVATTMFYLIERWGELKVKMSIYYK